MDDEAISDEELDTIEQLTHTSTPGPWESLVEGRDHDSGDSFIRTGDGGPFSDLYVSYAGWATDNEQRAVFEQRRADDMDFIAAARQDVPRLLAEVRRLRGLLAERGET